MIWKQLKGDMHYTLGTMGQSIFGGIYAIALWLVWTPTGQLVRSPPPTPMLALTPSLPYLPRSSRTMGTL